MAVKVVLNKKNKDDSFGHLGLQQFANGKQKKSLGIRVNADDFKNYYNSDFRQFSVKAPFDVSQINQTISLEIMKFENGFSDNPLPTPIVPTAAIVPTIQNYGFMENPNGGNSVLEYFKMRMELKKTESTKSNYNDVLRKMKKFLKRQGKSDFTFNEFTPEFIAKFKKYCLTMPDPKKMTEGGVRNYFRVLKAVYNDANNSGYYYFRRNPFILAKNEKYSKNEKNPLKINQVKALMEIEDLSYMHQIARNMFYFQILANGMRCSDVMFLRYEDFKNGRLFYKMMKTNNDSAIPVSFKMMKVFSEILGEDERYDRLLRIRQISDKATGNQLLTLAEIDAKIIENNPQHAFVEKTGFESYRGFTISENDNEVKELIDCRHQLMDFINSEFIDYMQKIIDEQNSNDFIFLKIYAPKQWRHFVDYAKGDILSDFQFGKYKAIRNKYNVALRELSKIYNDKIPNVRNRHELIIKMSSHVARNTFVDVLLEAGVDIYTISHGMVHSELKTTQNYLKKGHDEKRAGSANATLHNLL